MNVVRSLQYTFVFAILLGAHTLFSQSGPVSGSSAPAPLKHDPQADALIQQVLLAAGPSTSAATVTETTGTIRFGTDATQYPARIYTMGNDHLRTEVDRSAGTTVLVLTAGQAAFTSASGQTRQLSLLNSITERVEHIPTLSLLADDPSDHLQTEYLGSGQLNGISVEKIAVSWSQADTANDQQELLKRTRVVYSIDAKTLRIVQIEYTRSAEEDSNALMHYRIVYSDYSNFAGRAIPDTVTTYLNGAFLSELKVSSFQENADLPARAFDLPEVTK